MALLPECEVFMCTQSTPEWFAARCGIVTASTFKDVLAQGRGGAPSETRRKLIYATAAEILTGQPTEGWAGNSHTERGKAWESEVRDLYEATCADPVTQVGFIRRGRIGVSPDSMVGDVGGLEIKTHAPHILIPMLEAGVLPPEHKAQVQGCLLVTGWQWLDFRAYWRGLPQLKVRVHRDIEYLANLSTELARFHAEVDTIVNKYRGQ